MQFTHKFLKDLIAHDEVENEGETARLFTELYLGNFENQHQLKIIFQFKGKFYQVPYVMCGGLRFNTNLAEVEQNEFNLFIEALRYNAINEEELVECLPLEDLSIILSSEEADELLLNTTISFKGEKLHLTSQLYTEDEDYDTFSYKGDSYAFARDLVDEDGNIVCRTIPYIPALPFGVCGC